MEHRDKVLSYYDLAAKSGARVITGGGVLDAGWRDANTAALHSSIDWDTLSALYGTQQLGLQPQGIFEGRHGRDRPAILSALPTGKTFIERCRDD